MSRPINYRRQWFANRDLRIELQCYGRTAVRAVLKCDEGATFEKPFSSYDEAIARLPETIEQYETWLKTGVRASG